MPRSKRFFMPGYVWHITQRCHNREFLMKFKRDKQRWLELLFHAKKRFDLSILNYAVTSNHIHLLVEDKRYDRSIAGALHFVAGRMAWEYNKRKNRRGAYWEDRYHATAVETDKYLLECAAYIDLNMVRAGVVNHPAEWKFCGYQEILGLKKHKFLIDKDLLCSYFCIKDPKNLGRFYRAVIEEKIMQERSERESRWTDAIAVGSKEFTERFKQDLGIKARKRDIRITGANQNGYQIRESEIHFLASKS
ncbi:MAG: transposase [Candidatus Aminicenantes bacterium]|nr:transposase [Candidatus Aminicenantes bacterium]